MEITYKVLIEGMHCDACVRRVTSALEGVAGVAVGSVEVGSATIAFDPAKTSAKEIAASIGRIGFSANIEGLVKELR
jgi:copper chaperone